MKYKNKIKELREEHNLSQKKLASIIGYSQSVLCDWENQKVEPTSTPIIKLALFFDVSTDYLLGLEDEDGHKEPVDYDFEYSHADTKLIHREKGK